MRRVFRSGGSSGRGPESFDAGEEVGSCGT